MRSSKVRRRGPVKGARARPRSADQSFPCGCPAVVRKHQHGWAIPLPDGTRVCWKHGRRWRLTWTEVRWGEKSNG